jgi:YD repeat-containing protein
MSPNAIRRKVALAVAILVAVQSGVVGPTPAHASVRPPQTYEASAPAAPTPVVPYGASGWKYQQTSQGGLAGFEAVNFNDAAWPVGSSPFGSPGNCPVAAGVATTWSVNTDLLLRRSMSIPAGTQGVEVWIVVDNDAIGVYWNGTLIGGPLVHEGCADANQPMRFAVSAASVTGTDVLAIRLRDRGSESYGNVQVVTGAMPDEPATCDVQCLENGGFLGDPVQSFSGAFMYDRLDIAIPGRGPAPSFARSYNSRDDRTGSMGPGWMHNYSARLRHPGDGSLDLLFVGPDGNTDRFTRNNDETFSPPPAVDRTLVRLADGTFVVTEPSQLRWAFDAAGSLTAITDRFGNTSSLGYNAAGELITISDPAGRGSLALTYTAGKLTSVTDWASPARTVGYQYDAAGRLWKVTDREGNVTTFAYDGPSARLTTVTDARGNVALTLTYDAQGRVATQKDAKGLVSGATTTFAYVVNGDGTRVTTLTEPPTSFEPAFSPTTVDTYNAQGWLTSRVARPTSTETLTESYTYDPGGFRTSMTNPRGATTEFCYDRTHAGATIAGSRGNLTRIIAPAPTSPRPSPQPASRRARPSRAPRICPRSTSTSPPIWSTTPPPPNSCRRRTGTPTLIPGPSRRSPSTSTATRPTRGRSPG